MTIHMYGQVGTCYPGADWYWSDIFQTSEDLLQEVMEDYLFNLGDPEFERADYGLKLANGDVVIIARATDNLADLLAG